jgi:hypothetical protein
MVIFGGTLSNGKLVKNELYLLILEHNISKGIWIQVKINGQKPPSRYGHLMVFSNPYIFVIGG